MKYIFSILAAILTVSLSLEAAAVRISFLNTSESLQDTLMTLKTNRCSEQSIAIFKKAVENYYAMGFEFDASKFPQDHDGFYSFSNVQQLIASLPQRLSDTEHSYCFNCFDMVIALAGDQIKTGLKPDENFGPFMVSVVSNKCEKIAFAATARDAFTFLYPPWYREGTENLFSEPLQNKRVCLTPAMAGWHILPMSVGSENLDSSVLIALQASWKSQNVEYPQQFEVVLCHKVGLAEHTICSCHAGLLFRVKTGFIYLEKAGGKGPFIRLDFDNRGDLSQWLSSKFDEQDHKLARLFATFNSTKIINLNQQ